MVAEFATDLIENRLWLDDQACLALSTPPSDRSRQLGRRAVVVGAGIGGLAAAGALAQYFERVDILERDRLPHLGLRRVALCAQPDVRQMQTSVWGMSRARTADGARRFLRPPCAPNATGLTLTILRRFQIPIFNLDRRGRARSGSVSRDGGSRRSHCTFRRSGAGFLSLS